MSLGRGQGDAERGGSFGHRQAGEESQFHHSALIGLVGCQFGQSLVQREQIQRRRLETRTGGIEIDPLPLAAVFKPALVPGLLDQDSPHRFGGGGEEMAAAVPVLASIVITADQPQICLMHQRRRLQRLAGLSWASFAAASFRSSS